MGISTRLGPSDPRCGGYGRNPFQGGMGISTCGCHLAIGVKSKVAIPFRVGWGFPPRISPKLVWAFLSQSLSGWDGDFHIDEINSLLPPGIYYVAIPFRVGWGFPLDDLGAAFAWAYSMSQSLSGWDGDFHAIHEIEPNKVIWKRRNPFQGGMGISTCLDAYPKTF